MKRKWKWLLLKIDIMTSSLMEDIIRLFFDQQYGVLPLYSTIIILKSDLPPFFQGISILSRRFYELIVCLRFERIKQNITWNKSFRVLFWKFIRRDNPCFQFSNEWSKSLNNVCNPYCITWNVSKILFPTIVKVTLMIN